MKRKIVILNCFLLVSCILWGKEAIDYQQIIYEFLKRYTKELYEHVNSKFSHCPNMITDSIVTINGDFSNMPSEWNNLNSSIVYYKDKGYEALWTLDKDTLWHIAFPNSYELILGQTRNELELLLSEDIFNTTYEYKYSTYSESFCPINDSIFIPLHYLIYDSKELSTKSYYMKNEDGILSLVKDISYPKYAALNACQFPIFPDFQLSVKQSLYGKKTYEYVISMTKWLSYCQQHECTIYTGVEVESQNLLNILVLCENKQIGYNHIMSLLFPVKNGKLDITEPIQASLTAYIPTYNMVKN